MKSRQDYITALGSLVQGEYPPGEAAKILAIGQAVKTYSKHRPRICTEDEAGTGAFDYAVSLLAEWSDGFSAIQQVEYPVDDASESTETLDEDDWRIYTKPAGDYLRFLANVPVAGESFRVTYKALHICDDTQCTVKAIDEEAVQSLAAACYCEMLAAYFAQNQDSTIKADSVEHTSKTRDFSARAKAFRKIYQEHLGFKDNDSVSAAAAVSDLDLKYPGGGERLTHPRSGRKTR
jgi:hypothetical protein